MKLELFVCPSCGETISCPGCETISDLRRRNETLILTVDRSRNEWQRQRATIARLQERLGMYEGNRAYTP